jgi:hypothetical protein
MISPPLPIDSTEKIYVAKIVAKSNGNELLQFTMWDEVF